VTVSLDLKVTVALDVLCAQLTRDVFAIAKFLFMIIYTELYIRKFDVICKFYFTALYT